MENKCAIEWVVNQGYRSSGDSFETGHIIPPGISRLTRSFHRQIPGYCISPLKNLMNLAEMLGLGGIWIKDESLRLSLNSFKVLGGSFAIYQYLKRKLGMSHLELTFAELTSPEVFNKIGGITFASATDGNHGRGVAWAASKLGLKSVIYVHRLTSPARIRAIESYGARVEVIDGTYDDAVEKLKHDALEFDWQVISDTSWDGYEEIPKWIMQGYATLFAEAQEQLAAQGIIKPTHLFIQAGVGGLAAAGFGFYRGLFNDSPPMSVVIEPEKADCLLESAKANDGKPHSVEGELDTIMAGLACGDPSPLAWQVIRDCANGFLACPDYVAAKGMRVFGAPLDGDPSVISGESGAVSLGVLMFIMQRPEAEELRKVLHLGPESQVLLINTEGNTDPDYFRKVVWEGADPVPSEFSS